MASHGGGAATRVSAQIDLTTNGCVVPCDAQSQAPPTSWTWQYGEHDIAHSTLSNLTHTVRRALSFSPFDRISYMVSMRRVVYSSVRATGESGASW